MDIIKLLELSIHDISMSYVLFNTLGRAGYFRISDILFSGKDRIKCVKSLGSGRYLELKNILLNYGIDLDDDAKCNRLIQIYKKLKMKQLGDSAIEILEYPIEKVSNDVNMSAFLSNNGYNCVYDVLSQRPQVLIKSLSCGSHFLKEWGYSYYYVELMRNIFRYGIDITDREQCCKLNRAYRIKRSNKLKSSLDFSSNMDIVNLSLQLELLTDRDVLDYLSVQLENDEQLFEFSDCISNLTMNNNDLGSSHKVK